MAKLNFGLRIPAVHPTDVEAMREFVTQADALGFHSIWVGDHVFYHVDVLQPLHLLTWVAAQTAHVRLGTAVMLTAYQNPVLLAKAASTLDVLSNGRLTLGLSIGGSEAEYRSIGVPADQKVGRLLETVAIMRRLWTEDGVEHEGRYSKVERGTMKPKPLQQLIPVYFGANSDAMRLRIARVADGWVSSGATSIPAFLDGIRQVREAAAGRGRDPASLGFAKLHAVSVAEDEGAALRSAETQWKSYYGANYDVAPRTIYGPPEKCAEALSAFAAAESEEVTLVLEPSDLSLRQLELLHEAADLIVPQGVGG